MQHVCHAARNPLQDIQAKKCLVLEPSKRIYISSKIRIDGSGKLDGEEGYKKAGFRKAGFRI